MPTNSQLLCLLSAGVALVAGLVATRAMRSFAWRWDFVDKPDGGRKHQQQPVALGGGLAVAAATTTAILIAVVASWMGGGKLMLELGTRVHVALFAGATLILALGLIDDATGMKGRYKLLGQFMIGLLLIAAGLRIETVHCFGFALELGLFAIPFTLFWLLGAINVINLIDGIDGLAGSVGVVLSLSVAAISFLQGRFADVVIMLSLAGALAGFLRYNFAPATIYLGDAGSMLVGLVVGVMAVPGSAKSTLAIGLMVPVAVLSVPILDSAAAILRRKLTGRSVFAADRGHLHHSLLVRGWSVRQASLFIALICATTCLSAVLSVVWKNEAIALMTVVGVVLYLIFTKTFGHVEFDLVRDEIGHAAFSKTDHRVAGRGHERTIRLQGQRDWDKLWSAIVESAEEYQLVQAKLSINIPLLHEVYYATWRAPDSPIDKEQQWRLSHPLMIDDQQVGVFELAGVAGDPTRSTLSQIVQSLEFLEPIEEDIRQIRERIRVEQAEVRVGQPADGDDAPADAPGEESAGADSLGPPAPTTI